MKTSDKDHEMYYCLASDGEIYILGDHGDYEAAEATAESIGLSVVWMFGEDTARSWLGTLKATDMADAMADANENHRN